MSESTSDQTDDALGATGDRDALGRLYDRHCGRVMAVALRIVGNVPDAERVVQAAFTAAWEQRRNDAAVRADWQFTTADARVKLRKLYPTVDGLTGH